jgi:plastocyanin
MRLVTALLVGSAALAACSGGGPAIGDDGRPAAASAPETTAEPQAEPATAAPREARKVDPRDGGLEITLGEWAITPESDAIRPGRVTFVIHNRGTMPHGFEIELEGDSSGHGSGDLFKAESELLQPGESTRMTFDLGPAVYKIECLVDGHDDMGMEDMLAVRAGAPLVEEEATATPDKVAISDFAFAPATIEIQPGTEVTWHNDDPTDHTVTSITGDFGSDSLGTGDSFSHRFEEPGTFAYRCAIHPDMKGKVKVE